MTEEVKDIVSWLGMLGLPTLFGMAAWCMRKVRKFAKQMAVLAKAQQAQMRSQLLEQYHYYMDSGWISEEHMEDWENQYKAYHSLGENGVLDSRRADLLHLPNKKKEG